MNATNMGDDIPLHLAAAHGHLEVVQIVGFCLLCCFFYRELHNLHLLQLIRHRSDVNALNEHGNSPLHYACFWSYAEIAKELINHGSLVSLANKDGDTPLDKAKPALGQE